MIVLHTLADRWWALIFIPVFFWAATAERTWTRALRFLAIASGISLTAEYLSTHTGFPYGRYDYIAQTHGRELYISNVPIFVPLTFGIVVWVGRALINRASISPGRLIVGGAVVAAAIDLILDPMTLRGETWFLGPLYRYHSSGPWFSVPWSNYAGWVFVGAVILLIDEMFEAGSTRTIDNVRGPGLAFGMCVFFLLIAAATSRWAIFGASVGVSLALGVIRLAAARAKTPARVPAA